VLPIGKRITKQEAIKRLYAAMLFASEVSIIETSDISSKGIYMSRDGKQEVYIKQTLPLQEKLKVLLHEYGHYVHLTHYFNNESRAECEIIANGSASLICREYGLSIYKDVDLTKFSADPETVNRLTTTIQAVAAHILSGMRQTQEEDTP
jgi:hypothetical protein